MNAAQLGIRPCARTEGQAYGQHIDPEEEVFAEAVIADGGEQVGVGAHLIAVGFDLVLFIVAVVEVVQGAIAPVISVRLLVPADMGLARAVGIGLRVRRISAVVAVVAVAVSLGQLLVEQVDGGAGAGG